MQRPGLIIAAIIIAIVGLVSYQNIFVRGKWLAPEPLVHGKISITKLPGNEQAYWVPIDKLPILDLVLSFGIRDSYQSHKSQAVIMCALADNLQAELEQYGAEVRVDCAKDKLTASLRALSDHDELDKILKTFAKFFTPMHSDAAIKVAANKLAVAYEELNVTPELLAEETLFKNLFPTHPYGQSIYGDAATLAQSSLDTLNSFLNAYINKDNLTVTLGGDVNFAEAKEYVEVITKQLPAGTRQSAREIVVAFPKDEINVALSATTQATVFMALPGRAKASADKASFQLANYILGGNGLSSLLFRQVREAKGLVYGIRSESYALQDAGFNLLKFQTKRVSTREAIKATQDVLQEFRAQDISAEALEEAKKAFSNFMAIRLSSNKDVIHNIHELAFYNENLEYINEYAEEINNINKEQFMAVINKYFKVEPKILVVGEVDQQ